MEDQGVDILLELNKIVDNGGEDSYADKSETRSLVWKLGQRNLGILQEYQVLSVQVKVKSESRIKSNSK